MALKEDTGVVGAGTMGIGIAQIAATSGHTVYLYDAFPEQLVKAKNQLTALFDKLVEKGKYSRKSADEILNRINFSETLTPFKNAGLVIEAIIENADVKKDTFSRLEGIVPRNCILATNTSSLSIALISSALKHPDRFIGLHFFNPAPLMKLVEIVPGVATKSGLAEDLKKQMNEWGKIPVIAKDTPGFIVNRVARPFYGEALRIFEEGIADVLTIDAAMKQAGGFRMGPFELMDLIGHDINYQVTCSVFEAFYFDPRFKPSFTQKRLVEAGWLGRKTGRGFYNYRDEAAGQDFRFDEKKAKSILDRILAMLINEACDAVFMGVCSKEDVDLAMQYGVNYPKGLLKWADETGAANVLKMLENLFKEYGEDRYRPNPYLKHVVKNSGKFYV